MHTTPSRICLRDAFKPIVADGLRVATPNWWLDDRSTRERLHKRARELDPAIAGQPETIAHAFLQAGQADSAIALLEPDARNEARASLAASVLMLAYDAAGRSADAERIRARIVASGSLNNTVDRIVVALRDGDYAAALTRLEQRLGHDSDLWDTACSPLFDALRSEPRFLALMTRFGMEPCRASGPPLVVLHRR